MLHIKRQTLHDLIYPTYLRAANSQTQSIMVVTSGWVEKVGRGVDGWEVSVLQKERVINTDLRHNSENLVITE